jgi:hypothetical protein
VGAAGTRGGDVAVVSYDLGVWYSEKSLSSKEAEAIYLRLCEDGPHLEGESQAVRNFYSELVEHWPEIDTIPEKKIGDHDFCPWSCALDSSGMSVTMSCVWPMAEKVAAFVSDLATKHELVLYDPQTGNVYLPKHIKRQGFLARLFGRE